MILGKIVRSNSHADYLCQLFGRGEVAQPPVPSDYALGTFVRIPVAGQPLALVGLIYDTMLFNPEFGRLGPRLSGEAELAVFAPDYLNEKVTLVGIVAVGTMGDTGHSTHGVPMLSAATDALVERLDDAAVWTFHVGNPSLHVDYLPQLLARRNPLLLPLLCHVMTYLKTLTQEAAQVAMLDVLLDHLTWSSQIEPMGGGR